MFSPFLAWWAKMLPVYQKRLAWPLLPCYQQSLTTKTKATQEVSASGFFQENHKNIMKSGSQIANPKLILTLSAYSCLFRNIFYESSLLLVQTVSGSLTPKALSLSCETRGGFTWLHSDILQTRIGRPPKN